MNPQVRIKPDDTRERIMETAEMLFRRMGFAKTAVADIAAELRMSPANIYRFFDSKTAIVQAICKRCLLLSWCPVTCSIWMPATTFRPTYGCWKRSACVCRSRR